MKKIKNAYWRVKLAYRSAVKETKLFVQYLSRYKHYRKKTLQDREVTHNLILMQLCMGTDLLKKKAEESWTERIISAAANPIKSAQIARSAEDNETRKN